MHRVPNHLPNDTQPLIPSGTSESGNPDECGLLCLLPAKPAQQFAGLAEIWPKLSRDCRTAILAAAAADLGVRAKS